MVREQQGDASVVTEVPAGAESSMTATYETVSVNKRRITNCVSLSVHLDAVRSLRGRRLILAEYSVSAQAFSFFFALTGQLMLVEAF